RTATGPSAGKERTRPAQGPDSRSWHTVLAVDPADPDRVYVNGDEPTLLRGEFDHNTQTVTWTTINNVEDHVEVSFDFSGPERALVEVSDRGVLRCANPTAAAPGFEPKHGTLSNVLLYNVAVDPQDAAVAYGEAHDQFGLLN